MDLWCSILLFLSFYSCRRAPTEYSKVNGQIVVRNDSHVASNSKRPSPIDIKSENIRQKALTPLNNPFVESKFDKEPAECINDGSTISCTVRNSSAILFGGPLTHDYVFDTMHLHWGLSDSNGSEHLLNGRRFASEIHAIFRNAKYPNLKKASIMDDGLGIMAWVGMLSNKDNEAMNAFFTMAEKLVEFNSKHTGSARSLLGFLKKLAKPLNVNSTDWVTYDGALTMEPYSDCVKWIVHDKPFAISHRQLEILRHLKREDGTPNLEHSKEVLPLSGRSIYKPKGGEFHTDESNLRQHILS